MTQPNQRPPLLAQIRKRYAEFSPSDRKLADLILNFPGELPGYSASELAAIAQTSNAAVSRFVRRLGFQTYEEMRRLAREERDRGAPLYLLHRGLENGTLDDAASPPEPERTRLMRHVRTTIENLDALVADVNADELDDFAARLASARTVWVAGFRHGHYLAGYFRWSLAHVRPDVRLLPVGGETLGETLVDLGKDDALVLHAFRRRTANTATLIALAHEAGATVGLLADPAYIDNHGTAFVFRCPVTNRGPFDDHAAAFVLADVIVASVTARLGGAARDRLVEIDSRHAELSELEGLSSSRNAEPDRSA